MDMMMMQMYFYASSSCVILFEQWETTTWEEMLGSCLGIAVFAALYEGLKVLRDYVDYKMAAEKACKCAVAPDLTADERSVVNSQTTVIDMGPECHCGPHEDSKSASRRKGRHPIIATRHIIQTALYFVQLWIGFMLMLIFMTYNVYVCLAVTTGGALGYFCFSWMKKQRPDYDSEICH